MPLTDTHTHLEGFARSGQLEPVLDRARAAGLGRIVTIGTDTDDWRIYRDVAAKHPALVSYTVGLHPCSVGEDWAARVAQLEGFWAGAPAPVAIGETGLDRFHLPKDDEAAAGRILGWQRDSFAAHLAIAARLGCPLVVHSRGAFRECVEMVDAAGFDWGKVVFHCFTEGPAEMEELLRRGGFGSFTGIITYKNAGEIRAAAQRQGMGRLMLETDAPYLTPVPHRGKPNEPSYLRDTARCCAELFGVSEDELAAVTSANAARFFGLGA